MALGNEDIHKFDMEVPVRARFNCMILFLRKRFGQYNAQQKLDECLFRVDFTLPEENRNSVVKLYFRKEDLYLQGWAIDYEGESRYFAAQGGLVPQEATRSGKGSISLAYGKDVSKVKLGQMEMTAQLEVLHGYLSKVVAAEEHSGRPPDEKELGRAEKAFHTLARMTAEMARFDGFYLNFLGSWASEWSQSTTLAMDIPGVSRKETQPFEEAITNWAKLSKKARGGTDSLTYQGSPVSQAEAELILRDGARHGEPRP
ncbi:ribosome-inactivating family protein [Streptomyces sp. NPDC002018]|uniref:ribosome-inactivating family protein n=1 Tax=Streptomyces sp. NPDC002018 TaxID=3364629 RepID=UPI00367C315D